jgi:DNA-binding NarL/FixJ family response regulator
MAENISSPTFTFTMVDKHQVFSHSLGRLIHDILPGSLVEYFTHTRDSYRAIRSDIFHYLFISTSILDEETAGFVYNCRQHFPELKIVMIAEEHDMDCIRHYLRLGTIGYISRSIGLAELSEALTAMIAGQFYINKEHIFSTIRLYPMENKLSKKELIVLWLISGGCNVVEVSDLLSISKHTVMTHKKKILKKLGLHSTADLIRFAHKNHINNP